MRKDINIDLLAHEIKSADFVRVFLIDGSTKVIRRKEGSFPRLFIATGNVSNEYAIAEQVASWLEHGVIRGYEVERSESNDNLPNA